MHPNLSFEQAPPASVPFRFFLTAPWFGMLAGLLLLFEGGAMLQSRWMPEMLAATHLLVAGFMLQVMCGALLQFIPVAAGGNVWRPRWVAGFCHPLLIASACLLVAAFLSQRAGLYVAAAHGFAVGLGAFVLVVAAALWRTPASGATLFALRLAVAGLLVTVALGVMLARWLAQGEGGELLRWVDIHAAWGLGGWGLVLLAGVAYFVVPMFQLTPAYPKWLAYGFPSTMLVALLAWSMSWPEPWPFLGFGLGLMCAATLAIMTLILQSRRRRKVRDTTLLYFRLSMASLLLLSCLGLLVVFPPVPLEDPRIVVTLGALAVTGVFMSAIMGMLYKIIPFISWLHLQRACGVHAVPPTMNQIIPEKRMRHQFHMHCIAVAAVLAAPWADLAARPAGALLAVDCAWLGVNLAGGVLAYQRFKGRIPASG